MEDQPVTAALGCSIYRARSPATFLSTAVTSNAHHGSVEGFEASSNVSWNVSLGCGISMNPWICAAAAQRDVRRLAYGSRLGPNPSCHIQTC